LMRARSHCPAWVIPGQVIRGRKGFTKSAKGTKTNTKSHDAFAPPLFFVLFVAPSCLKSGEMREGSNLPLSHSPDSGSRSHYLNESWTVLAVLPSTITATLTTPFPIILRGTGPTLI